MTAVVVQSVKKDGPGGSAGAFFWIRVTVFIIWTKIYCFFIKVLTQ